MPVFLARLLYLLATLVGLLPSAVQRAIATAAAALGRAAGSRESRVTLRNLELAYPELSPDEREALRRAVLRTTALQTLETLRLWTRRPARNLRAIREQHGVGLFDAELASGKGLIVVAPHYGNWELLNQWLAARTPISILYRAPDSAVGEAFLRLVRARAGDGDRVRQVRAEGPAVRQLWKTLRDGGVTGILPDQQPKAGDGEFAPFFGLPALTMTLVPRLAERTGATVLYAYCERIGDGPGFALRIEPAPDGIADADVLHATAVLNAGVEHIARRDPAQYQWTYKRYKARPSGSGDDNPYLDLERRR
ncbi:lauroyl acyltransferase [Luteimonas sp. FCS-9]|uniref:lauroyl acyltransferase n=1 Tax=Luteimonas sp. FCS-9 TaxID=1547516 RepID=UPI00063E6DDD|nr:lauroyl acyltransferase [Luteimonas sp. FCS-9]KLJ00120.1 lipid A biosynthesis lauroyl acyltransferase [Luteimonas sp. FCS-9]